jgi:hypothetical protein
LRDGFLGARLHTNCVDARWGIDTGWASLTDKPTKLQVSGTAGLTFNFENTATNYQSGNEFHWEWAVGIECMQGLVLGVRRL